MKLPDKLVQLKRGLVRGNKRYYTSEEGTQYAYDAWRNVKSIRHADGGLYTCTHDYAGRLLFETSPVQNAAGAEGTRYEYDADFNRVKTIYAGGGVLRERHDACGNVTMRILPEQYDEKTDGGAGYSYGYDSRDRLVSVTTEQWHIDNTARGLSSMAEPR